MRKRLLAGILLPLVLVAAAACSQADDGAGVASVSGTAAPSPTPSLSELEQAIGYVRCMRANGVPMPDPEVVDGNVRIGGGLNKDGVDEDTLRNAEEACKQYRPVPPPELATQKLQLAREESRCMRANGVENFPDPKADLSREVPESIRQDPQYEQAEASCFWHDGRSPSPGASGR
ncbi:hypothetical protein [Micromonospora sp. NPDC093277]|uniref:hypothetical protein n=1 Tax=Micromonospora sp. NPDC093277 TaxID=3364291 RepID=UPI00381742C1